MPNKSSSCFLCFFHQTLRYFGFCCPVTKKKVHSGDSTFKWTCPQKRSVGDAENREKKAIATCQFHSNQSLFSIPLFFACIVAAEITQFCFFTKWNFLKNKMKKKQIVLIISGTVVVLLLVSICIWWTYRKNRRKGYAPITNISENAFVQNSPDFTYKRSQRASVLDPDAEKKRLIAIQRQKGITNFTFPHISPQNNKKKKS